MWHSCARYRVADHFKGKPAAMRALFRKLAALVRSFGPVHTYAQRSRIVFQARARFAGVAVRRSHLEVALWLKRPVALPRFHRTEFIPPDNNIHYVRLRTPAELDPVITTLLREAYGVGCQLHLLERLAVSDTADPDPRGRKRRPNPAS